MAVFHKITDWKKWVFQWRYFRKQTPWDTRITPPEVVEFLNTTPPGRALDLGCGTGTNALALARKGWTVTGVDFSSLAIARARKTAREAGFALDFHTADVSDLDFLSGPYDFALDIGCLFTLDPEKRKRYARHLERLLGPGACFMIYAWLKREDKGGTRGISVEEVEALFGKAFTRKRLVIGEEKGFGSAWYWYERR